MKLRAFATICSIASMAGLLGGCAGTPSRDISNWEIGNRPQTVIPGANVPELKGLAMGSAKSKGWTIVKSTDNLVVMQRPLDPGSPSARALGPAAGAAPMVEVTSAFREESGGVKVGLGAELVAQSSGDKAPKRLDYTETYRDALERSLESLKANWSANRQRLANAMPPLPSSSGAIPSPDSPEANANPLVKTWAEAVSSQPRTASTASPAPGATAQTAAEPRVAPAAQPEPQAWGSAPAAEPREAGGAAPVLDASRTVDTTSNGTATSSPPSTALAQPPAAPEPVAPGQNMLTLSQSSGTGAWAYYAEQYARVRGCDVAPQGTQMLEARSDGEIHRVSCVGADAKSFLLKCQNGVCRSLE